jgi:hypothetical protein
MVDLEKAIHMPARYQWDVLYFALTTTRRTIKELTGSIDFQKIHFAGQQDGDDTASYVSDR